jgi:trehalose synthase
MSRQRAGDRYKYRLETSLLQRVDVAVAPLDDYRKVVGEDAIERLEAIARDLKGARIAHINATPFGGGVSELLRSTVAIMRGLGLDVEWRVISGNDRFFEVTKAFHNALQGAEYHLTAEARETYLLQNQFNAAQLDDSWDVVFVHDPQPAAMLEMHGVNGAKWIWRCHIDTSHPNTEVLEFLTPYIEEHDALVFTLDSFVPPSLRDRNVSIMPPAIDPLSPKNFDVLPEQSRRIMSWVGIDPDRPVLTQVSRFDQWKDPKGVINVYRQAREKIPGLQLALLGSMALDDPEAWDLLNDIQNDTGSDKDILVATNLTGIGNMEVNVFQRSSDVVVQKSIREGFGLIVSETLWKGTPMVAGNVGGIPIQMPDGAGGFLVDPHDNGLFAEKIAYLLSNPEEARALGLAGKEVVRDRFLITRLVEDELRLAASLINS